MSRFLVSIEPTPRGTIIMTVSLIIDNTATIVHTLVLTRKKIDDTRLPTPPFESINSNNWFIWLKEIVHLGHFDCRWNDNGDDFEVIIKSVLHEMKIDNNHIITQARRGSIITKQRRLPISLPTNFTLQSSSYLVNKQLSPRAVSELFYALNEVK